MANCDIKEQASDLSGIVGRGDSWDRPWSPLLFSIFYLFNEILHGQLEFNHTYQ